MDVHPRGHIKQIWRNNFGKKKILVNLDKAIARL